MTKTPVNMHGLMIELWSVWYFIEFVVLRRWAQISNHAVWDIHMLYPWQPGAVVEDSGLSVNARSSEEQKEAEVYHVMTVSSPQLQDTEHLASTATEPELFL